MGKLTNFVKKVAGATPEQKAEKIQRQNIETAAKHDYWIGYEKGAKEREFERGRKAAKSKSGNGGFVGLANTVVSSLNNAEKTFGFDGGGTSIDFGLGESVAHRKATPRKKAMTNKNWMQDLDDNNPF